MNRAFLFRAGLATLAVMLLGCQDEPEAGTRTHWLQPCDTGADCSAEADCICNVCTRLCDAQTDCDGGSCAPLVSAVGLCGSETIEGRICLPPETSEECSQEPSPNWGFGGFFAKGCETEGVLLCEDFEQEILDAYLLGYDGAEVRQEHCLSHEGSSSIAFSGLEDEGFGHVQMPLAQAVDSGPLHIRFWVYVPSSQDLDASVRLLALRESAEYTPEQVGLLLTSDQAIRFNAEGVQVDSAASAVALDQWQCVQASLDVGAQGSAEVSLDGKLVVEVAEAPTRPAAGPIGVASVFGSVFSPRPRLEIAVDDLIVSTSPIDCD